MPPRKLLFASLIFIIACASLIVFGILPLVDGVRLANGEVLEKRIRLATVTKERENFVVLSKNFESVSSQIELLDSLILKSNESLTFVSEIEKYADESNVRLDLDLAELQASREVQIVPTTFRVDGSYLDTLEFLRKLDTSPYYVVASAVRLLQGDANAVEVTLQGSTYWVEDEL